MQWLAILLVAAGVLVVYVIAVSLVLLRVAIIRTDAKDYNFNPETDDEATFPPSGKSPYRTNSRDGNIWWNKQTLIRMEITSFDGL